MMANREASALLGHSTSRITDEGDWRAYPELKGLHPDGRPYAKQEWPLKRSLATGEAVRNEEIIYVGPDGTRRTVLASSAAVRDPHGAVVAAVATFASKADPS